MNNKYQNFSRTVSFLYLFHLRKVEKSPITRSQYLASIAFIAIYKKDVQNEAISHISNCSVQIKQNHDKIKARNFSKSIRTIGSF